MSSKQQLDIFITRMARKIAYLYPNSYADEEDYIQTGHLKLAEIYTNEYNQRHFTAYAIISIARAMRKAAVDTMCATHAPCHVKERAHMAEKLSSMGITDKDICEKLGITQDILFVLRSLIRSESLNALFEEPTYNPTPFSELYDFLSSKFLTDDDRTFLESYSNGDTSSLMLSRKQMWSRTKNVRKKVLRSGYEIG
jgi:hypothetical protein